VSAKRILLVLAAAALAAGAAPLRAAEGARLDRVRVDLTDVASLQSGARTFVNYCLNCHGASLVRYNTLRQIGLSDEQIKDNLMFTAEKIGLPMAIAMAPRDAKSFFGTPPPDLSVLARARGADWLYTYLRTFYRDGASLTGWNNAIFPNVGMPHVLWRLQGEQVLKETPALTSDGRPVIGEDGKPRKVAKLELLTPGALPTAEYDQLVYDLVNFLVWMGEPNQLERQRLGVWVLFALIVLIFLTYFLKQAYWKNVH
jgi:ubiquinol-cytochrome c reductase cytochrome c1 subunit